MSKVFENYDPSTGEEVTIYFRNKYEITTSFLPDGSSEFVEARKLLDKALERYALRSTRKATSSAGLSRPTRTSTMLLLRVFLALRVWTSRERLFLRLFPAMSRSLLSAS